MIEVLCAGPAVAALAGQIVARARPFVAAGACAAGSSTLLAVWLWYLHHSPAVVGFWPLVGTAALAANAVLVCRWAPPRAATAAASVTVLAESLLALPLTGPAVANWRDAIAVCLFWSLAGIAGACFGLYLRQLDTARVRAVRQARRAQRVQLATDLHDFVAHDVSAMVVQVQAARVLLPGGPDEVAGILERVEADGVRALSAMDRTMQLLRELEIRQPEDLDRDSDIDGPGATELPELVRRFALAWDGPVSLNSDPDIASKLPAPIGAAAYRVVLEALTNVRRHARPGAVVEVHLQPHHGSVKLSVSNEEGTDLPVPSRPSPQCRSGGTGLTELANRVERLGGMLDFGPTSTMGWRVRAELPTTAPAGPR
ncbi:sensor histidine kinase [Actinoplanes sp. M2I2]|uniref:sensor histidine kinase n=1 Tax=Actinoplanes sp. M2I2 TaxID=1734444 RepID=UPI00201FC5C2|nr:histidine kinase [Actinoplanes sp. M2I2]